MFAVATAAFVFLALSSLLATVKVAPVMAAGITVNSGTLLSRDSHSVAGCNEYKTVDCESDISQFENIVTRTLQVNFTSVQNPFCPASVTNTTCWNDNMPPPLTYQLHHEEDSSKWSVILKWTTPPNNEGCHVNEYRIIRYESSEQTDLPTCQDFVSTNAATDCLYGNGLTNSTTQIRFRRTFSPHNNNNIYHFKVIGYPAFEFPTLVIKIPKRCSQEHFRGCQNCRDSCTPQTAPPNITAVNITSLMYSVQADISWLANPNVQEYFLHVNTSSESLLYRFNESTQDVVLENIPFNQETYVWMEQFSCGCSNPTSIHKIYEISNITGAMPSASISTAVPSMSTSTTIPTVTSSTPATISTSTTIPTVTSSTPAIISTSTTIPTDSSSSPAMVSTSTTVTSSTPATISTSTTIPVTSSTPATISTSTTIPTVTSSTPVTISTSTMLVTDVLQAVSPSPNFQSGQPTNLPADDTNTLLVIYVVITILSVIIIITALLVTTFFVYKYHRKIQCVNKVSSNIEIPTIEDTIYHTHDVPVNSIYPPVTVIAIVAHDTCSEDKEAYLAFLDDLTQQGADLQVYCRSNRTTPADWLHTVFKPDSLVLVIINKQFHREWKGECIADVPLVFAFKQLVNSLFQQSRDLRNFALVIPTPSDKQYIPDNYFFHTVQQFALQDTEGMARYVFKVPEFTVDSTC